jgi:phosphatidylinositol alpha-1,6-mannosyltransferase
MKHERNKKGKLPQADIIFRPERVALIALATQCFGPDFGGIEVLMTGLADAIAANGQEIEVFADHIRRRDAGELARPYPIRRFGSIRPLRRWMKRRAITERARNGFGGVFADSWKSIAAIPAGVGPIAVFAYGADIPQDVDSPRARRVRAALSRARTVIAISEFTAELTRRVVGSASANIVVVHPPLNLQEVAEPAALATIDARIAGRGPVVSTLSRLEPRKGVDMVLAALPRLRQHFPGIVYLVGGAGEDLPRLRQLAATLGVEGQVEFLGRLPDEQGKAALFERSDVFAMPVRRVDASVEGFGIVYGEAAWRGVPSLAGAEGGASDAVLDGKTGLVRRGDDVEAVQEALTTLLADDGLRARLGEAARRRAREDLSWPHALPRYLAALGL